MSIETERDSIQRAIEAQVQAERVKRRKEARRLRNKRARECAKARRMASPELKERYRAQRKAENARFRAKSTSAPVLSAAPDLPAESPPLQSPPDDWRKAFRVAMDKQVEDVPMAKITR